MTCMRVMFNSSSTGASWVFCIPWIREGPFSLDHDFCFYLHIVPDFMEAQKPPDICPYPLCSIRCRGEGVHVWHWCDLSFWRFLPQFYSILGVKFGDFLLQRVFFETCLPDLALQRTNGTLGPPKTFYSTLDTSYRVVKLAKYDPQNTIKLGEKAKDKSYQFRRVTCRRGVNMSKRVNLEYPLNWAPEMTGTTRWTIGLFPGRCLDFCWHCLGLFLSPQASQKTSVNIPQANLLTRSQQKVAAPNKA